MMRLACTSISFQRAFSSGQLDLTGFVDICRELDLDGVDLNCSSFPRNDPSYLKQLKLRCLRHGLSLACLSISNDFAKPVETLTQEIEMTKRWIDVALLLGAPQVRVFAGRPLAAVYRQDAWATAARCLKEVADYGYERGVYVALQNHNHGALTEYGTDVLSFVAEAGPHLGHVWDTGQYVGSPGATGADPEQAAQEVLYQSLQQTVHLATHVRTKIYRIETGEERWLDYPRIFKLLRDARYNGFCSIVYEGPGDELVAVSKAAAYLRRFVG